MTHSEQSKKFSELSLKDVILLHLGERPTKIPYFNFEKEMFLLWYSFPELNKLFRFVPSRKLGFSKELYETVRDSTDHYWKYNSNKISITSKGSEVYKELYNQLIENKDHTDILTGICITRGLYDAPKPDELFLMMMDVYPQFLIKSEISKKICDNHDNLLKGMLKRNIIDEERANYIAKCISRQIHE